MLQTRRRLVSVLAADIVAYTRLMEVDEETTHGRVMRLRDAVMRPGVDAFRGKILKNTGDGFLAMFESVHDAVDCARFLQRRVAEETAGDPESERIAFRMAINVADAIIDEDDIYGDGVNIAARLQTYAEPGGIVISGAVAEQIGPELGLGAIDLGELPLRNLTRPVRVIALRSDTRPPLPLGDILPGSEQRASIAVLPFRKHQIGPEGSYFADGIVDDIIHALAGLKELFVISRGSTLDYAGSTLDVRAIGRELGVRYVLYGSVRRSDGMLRICTELSDAETGAVISTAQYDGSLAELFPLQDRITISVVKTIAPHVRDRELMRVMRKHPQNMTAYDLLLQAQDLLYRMDADSFARARGLLQQAIALDPSFAPAYTYTAYWYVFRVGEMGSAEREADAAAAVKHAAAAVERNPDDALALAIYGHVQAFLLMRCDRARELLDRALAAGPSSAMAWTMSSACHGYVGNGKEAVEHAEQGLRLSPLDRRLFWHEGILAQAHYVAGDFERAVGWARSTVERNDSIRFTLRTLVAALAALGRKDEAAEAAKQLLRIQPDFRLAAYRERCPFQGASLERWIEDLRAGGLPD